MKSSVMERFRFNLEGPPSWLWLVGAFRIAVLLIMALGVYVVHDGFPGPLLKLLGLFYALGLVSCVWYLIYLRRLRPRAHPLLTWAQVLMDFGIVAATVSFTGGNASFFTFLFVVVILEAGLLLGLGQGFIFATFALIFMTLQLIEPDLGGFSTTARGLWRQEERAVSAYRFIVQAFAFYLTASISGYWNQRVRRIQQFQREILDNMNNGFIIADIEGMVMVLNRAGAAILGFEEGEAPGRSVQSVLTPASSEESPVLAALRTQRDFTRYEFEVRTANGEERLIGLTTSGMYNPSGRMTGVIANFTDLTELSAMREELQRQDRLAAVGEMAGGLAHEIRNPVAAVRGAIEELRGGPDSAIAERLAAIALRECDNLNDIITDFLEFARNPEVQREPLDVCELVRAETAALAETANGDVRVELGDCPERVVVSADENQMRQVLHNIGKNALEAMSDTGGVLRLSVSADNVSAAILMEDQGPGIPPDHLAHIFEPFYTTKDAGVGMGLAIAMRIVTAHDGAIHAASRKEGGAAFTVRLPLVRAKEIPGV